MSKKLIVFISLFLLLISTSYALSIETVSDIPPRKSSETIEQYKARVRSQKQQYIEEYKEQLRQQKQVMLNGSDDAGDKLDQTRNQVRERVCENIEEKIDLKVARFEENKDTHVEKYNRLKDRLTTILNDLEEKGFDVAQLAEDLTTLDELILEYAQAYSDFVDSLIFTRGFACGESDGDFRDNLRESKELLVIVKQKRAAIREFYVEVIREDIKDLREQAEELADEEEADADEIDSDGTAAEISESEEE